MSRRLNLTVQYASDAAHLPQRAELRAWLRAALNNDGMRGGQITVRFVDEEEARRLNHSYRDRDYATNILSFPYENADIVCGDLLICAPVVAKEAAEQGKALTAHYAHLVVHGALHLQGYEHETNAQEASRMEACERKILADFGYADPYADAL